MKERSDSCRGRPGVRSRWPRVARDHAATCSAPRGCVQPAGVSPGTIHWAIYRRNLDGSELRYYLAIVREDTKRLGYRVLGDCGNGRAFVVGTLNGGELPVALPTETQALIDLVLRGIHEEQG